MRGGAVIILSIPSFAPPRLPDEIEMNANIIKSIFYFLLFTPLQYWQLTRLIENGEVNKNACFWIVVNTVFIALAAANLVKGLEKAD